MILQPNSAKIVVLQWFLKVMHLRLPLPPDKATHPRRLRLGKVIHRRPPTRLLSTAAQLWTTGGFGPAAEYCRTVVLRTRLAHRFSILLYRQTPLCAFPCDAVHSRFWRHPHFAFTALLPVSFFAPMVVIIRPLGPDFADFAHSVGSADGQGLSERVV